MSNATRSQTAGDLPKNFISGKRLTVVVVATLLTTGFFFYWLTTAYAAHNAARRETERRWRELATVLAERYRALDGVIAKGVDSREVDMRLGERWRSLRDRFSGTGLSVQQAAAAEELETLMSQLPASLADEPTETLREASHRYTAAVEHQKQLGRTAGSRMLKLMLNLPDPPAVHVHALAGAS